MDSGNVDSSNVREHLKKCLSAVTQGGAGAALITDDTNLFDVGIDSMNMTELVLAIEEHFGLFLSPEDLSADLFTRFERLVDFVQAKLVA